MISSCAVSRHAPSSATRSSACASAARGRNWHGRVPHWSSPVAQRGELTSESGHRMTTAMLSCRSCGTQLNATAKFCSECGTPVAQAHKVAEFKQVTVLFADVVRSMDIAAAVGAERLREIMTELVDRATAVVKRYGGTVDKFTGDGIMAVFGAPTAMEDHAVRACLAALGIQDEVKRLAVEVEHRDG